MATSSLDLITTSSFDWTTTSSFGGFEVQKAVVSDKFVGLIRDPSRPGSSEPAQVGSPGTVRGGLHGQFVRGCQVGLVGGRHGPSVAGLSTLALVSRLRSLSARAGCIVEAIRGCSARTCPRIAQKLGDRILKAFTAITLSAS